MRLRDLRRHVVDNAADMADGKAARMTTRHINAALEQCASSHDWSFLRDRQPLVLGAPVTGSALAVVQGSELFTLTLPETWLQTYVDQDRELAVEGDDGVHYGFDSLVTPQIARMTSAWTGDSDATATWTLYRVAYDLPTNTSVVDDVRLTESQSPLTELTPADFDWQKQEQIGSTGDPIFYVVRGDVIEFWPVPTVSRSLVISRKRVPARVTDTTPESTVIDWPDRFTDVLLRALDMQVVMAHSKTTTLNPMLTNQAWATTIARAKETDGLRQPGPLTFGLRRPISGITASMWRGRLES